MKICNASDKPIKAPPAITVKANMELRYLVAHQEPISITIVTYGRTTRLTRSQIGVLLRLKIAPVSRNMMLTPNK